MISLYYDSFKKKKKHILKINYNKKNSISFYFFFLIRLENNSCLFIERMSRK
jgi:hypothetical protein